jgi:hypothetical protein
MAQTVGRQSLRHGCLRRGRIRQEMQSRLAEMRRYAEKLGTDDCYRGSALAYFGASKPPTMKSECCNLCDPNLDLPWHNVTPVDFAAQEEVMDARYVLLQAVHWNQSLEDQPYRAPYGAHSLSYLLAGNRHMLGRNQQDPTKRARGWRKLRAAPTSARWNSSLTKTRRSGPTWMSWWIWAWSATKRASSRTGAATITRPCSLPGRNGCGPGCALIDAATFR